MLQIQKGQLPCDTTELAAMLQRYKDALNAHSNTVGVPAPWPEHDIIFNIMNSGGKFAIIDPPLVPEPTTDTGFTFGDLIELLKSKSIISDRDINTVVTAKMLKPGADKPPAVE